MGMPNWEETQGLAPELAGRTTYPTWPINASGLPRKSWKAWLGRGMSAISTTINFVDLYLSLHINSRGVVQVIKKPSTNQTLGILFTS